MTTLCNRVRAGFYLDSVALMRLSQTLAGHAGIEAAAMMIGTGRNKDLLREAGLLGPEGEAAAVNDLIVAVRAATAADGDAALADAEALLDGAAPKPGAAGIWRPRSLGSALDALDGANLALISVPGEFAAAEARRALSRGLDVMLFSDNVPVEDERALKQDAAARGLLMMGPDCGTALIGGVPLAFANEVPRGPVGIVSASGTGLQEVSCLIARAGGGVSHGIGVGGRDLSAAVGGLMTLAAIDALDTDPDTTRVVLISKPPEANVARAILARVARSKKPFTICFLGLADAALPANAALAPTLAAAATDALDGAPLAPGPATREPPAPGQGRRWIRGLFAGGTLCAEAQIVLRAAGEDVASNVPVPGVRALAAGAMEEHKLIDLGADEYTSGRPHPMIEPSVRDAALAEALVEPGVAVVLLDLVIGHGAHENPARAVADVLAAAPAERPVAVASVTGTDADPQGYVTQALILGDAGVYVAPSNAAAAKLACRLARG